MIHTGRIGSAKVQSPEVRVPSALETLGSERTLGDRNRDPVTTWSSECPGGLIANVVAQDATSALSDRLWLWLIAIKVEQ